MGGVDGWRGWGGRWGGEGVDGKGGLCSNDKLSSQAKPSRFAGLQERRGISRVGNESRQTVTARYTLTTPPQSPPVAVAVTNPTPNFQVAAEVDVDDAAALAKRIEDLARKLHQ